MPVNPADRSHFAPSGLGAQCSASGSRLGFICPAKWPKTGGKFGLLYPAGGPRHYLLQERKRNRDLEEVSPAEAGSKWQKNRGVLRHG